MEIVPFDWSVVLLGRWNKAILTPGRVATKIFDLPKGNLVEVKVPIDGISPYQIKHPEKNIFLIAGSARIQICLTKMCFSDMDDARQAGINTLNWLPETPISAVGFNVNYRFTNTDPDLLEKALGDQIIPVLSGLTVKKHILSKAIDYKGGNLNLTFTYQNDVLEISLNFHKESDQISHFVEWLNLPVVDIRSFVEDIFSRLRIVTPQYEEIEDGE